MGRNDFMNNLHLMKMQMDMNASLIAGKNPKGGPLNVNLSELGKKLDGASWKSSEKGKTSKKGKASQKGKKSDKSGKAGKKYQDSAMEDGAKRRGQTDVDGQAADDDRTGMAAERQREDGAGSRASGGRGTGSGAGVNRSQPGAGAAFGQSAGRQGGSRQDGQYVFSHGAGMYPARMDLRQAVVWSEVLGEPVSKRRRRQRMSGQPHVCMARRANGQIDRM